ncbi:MAG: hypothetical protein K9H64_22405 [Bacteroidales bacterium]|nr:hypothetical protein [Bacteroidales bacterium]MCF8458800.1 hypothetical protein [Bacteroidales bacterium]
MKKIYYLMFIGLTALLLLGQSGLYAQITNIEAIDAQCFGSVNGKVLLTTALGTTISNVLVDGLPADSLSNNKKKVDLLPYGNHTLTVSFSAPVGLPDSVFSVFIDQPTALAFQISYTYDCANMEVPEICATNNGSNTNFGGVPPSIVR